MQVETFVRLTIERGRVGEGVVTGGRRGEGEWEDWLDIAPGKPEG